MKKSFKLSFVDKNYTYFCGLDLLIIKFEMDKNIKRICRKPGIFKQNLYIWKRGFIYTELIERVRDDIAKVLKIKRKEEY